MWELTFLGREPVQISVSHFGYHPKILTIRAQKFRLLLFFSCLVQGSNSNSRITECAHVFINTTLVPRHDEL